MNKNEHIDDNYLKINEVLLIIKISRASLYRLAKKINLLKLLFMGIKNAQEKWTMPIRNWSLTISQLAIHFEGRLDDALNL